MTAVIGSGVLALAWSVAQLGWVAGPLALAGFACVTYYTSTLLANAYRAPHPVTGDRNRTYMDAVRSYLSTRAVSPHLHGQWRVRPLFLTDERRNAWKSQVPGRCSCAGSPSTSTCGAPWSATPSPRP